MEPSQDLARWVCGFCDSTAAELSPPTHPPLEPHAAVLAHVLEAHGILPADLEASGQIGPTWTLPDGQVWLREIRPDPA